MTVLGICAEWLITFIETAMCHLFFHLFFADRFPKKKQRILFLFIAAVTTTGGILLNLVELSFSVMPTLGGAGWLLNFTHRHSMISRA